MSDLATDYDLLTTAVAAVELDRDVIRVSGPDALSYLQGQLSQDMAAIPPGTSAWSLVLQPQGRIDAWVRVSRLGDDTFLLDLDGGHGEALTGRLQRFKLRVKANIEQLEWRCVAVRGPQARPAGAGPAGARPAEPGPSEDGGFALPFDWNGFRGYDLLGPGPVAPAPLVGTAAYEVRRIEAGLPRMGAELTERTIPEEAGVVAASVSFTKGCYTGQELVARIDSRGANVPRRLRGLIVDGPVEVGAPIEVGGKAVGAVTSAAAHPAGHWVALGYTGRDVDPPVDGRCGGAVASIRALPLLT
jgi:folate-binding protein YgfZ